MSAGKRPTETGVRVDSQILYRIAADAVLLAHALFVAFVVLGLLCIYLGGWLGWRWVRRPLFRYCHLGAVAIVVAQSWVGVICPLTTWEMALRERAGEASYSGAFIAHWLESLLYYRAPAWVFTLVYTIFGGLVLLSWFAVPAQSGARRRTPG